MQFKSVMTWSAAESKVRLFRVIWERGIMGKGGYSACFSVALVPKLFSWGRDWFSANGWRLIVLGISLHYRTSYGGRFI